MSQLSTRKLKAVFGAPIAALVFVLAAAVAWLIPATYRTSATVELGTIGGQALPVTAPRALQELRKAALEHTVEVSASAGNQFHVTATASSAEGAQSAANTAAQDLVKRAPQLLGPPPVPSGVRERHATRQRRVQELADFVAQHPELAAATPAPASPQMKQDDALLSNLVAERASIDRKLAELSPDAGLVSDAGARPPLDAGDAGARASAEYAQLERRRAEINRLIRARRQAAERPPEPTSKIAPEVHVEWRKRLQAVAELGTGRSELPADVRVTAKLASEAPLPDAPISPNRSLILLLGALAGIALGGGWWFAIAVLNRHAHPLPARGGRPAGTASGARAGGAEHPLAKTALIATPQPARPDPDAQPGPGTERMPEAGPRPARAWSRVPTLIGSGNSELLAAVQARVAAADPAGARPSSQPPPARQSTITVEGTSSSDEPPGTRRNFLEDHAAALRARSSAPPKPEADPRPSAPPDARGGSQPPGARTGPSPTAYSESAPPSRPRRKRPGSQGTLLLGSMPSEVASAHGSSQPPPAQTPSRSPASSPTLYRYSSAPPPPEPDKPVLNAIPVPPGWHPDAKLVLPLHKTLREQLYAAALDRCFTLVIVGTPDAEDAASRVAAGLAIALAETGHPRILLVDADFHRPAMNRLMQVDVPVSAGFSHQLHSRISGGHKPGWNVMRCSPTLHVLGEGLMRSPGMILSTQFEESIRDLRSFYDVIVIDGPATSFELDCRALDSLADGVAIISRKEASPDVSQARALFSDKALSTVILAPEPAKTV